ncbi:hypothetical protein [Flavobacterium sp.]
MKNKIGFCLRILSLLVFCFIITPSFSLCNEPTPYLVIIVLLLLFLNFSQLLHPISIKENTIIYISLIAYLSLIYIWSIDYGFKKDFEYKGESLSYRYSPFNGTYSKLFGNNSYNFTSANTTRKKLAINYFIFLQCHYYETEQRYTSKQKEQLKNGTAKIILSNVYSKGNLKDFITESIRNDKEYYDSYKNLTKQSTVEIDTVLKYRYTLFNIQLEE